MKTKIRNLLIIPAAFAMLFLTGCASAWYGCLAIAYGFASTLTDTDDYVACEAPDNVIIIVDPLVPNPVTDCGPAYDSDSNDNHDTVTEYDDYEQNTKPVLDTHREAKSNQSNTSRRPFTRR